MKGFYVWCGCISFSVLFIAFSGYLFLNSQATNIISLNAQVQVLQE